MSNENEKLIGPPQEIPCNAILADAAFNVRVETGNAEVQKTDAKELDILVKAFKKDGQITPILVRETKVPGKYSLVAGFRRFSAAKTLGWTTIRASVCQLDDEEAYYLNLKENLIRKDLSTFELAKRCHDLKRMFKHEAKDISSRLYKSESYANNLIRCFEALHPKILEAWKNRNPVCQTNTLVKWAGMSKQEQLDEFTEATGPKKEATGDAEGDKADKEVTPKSRKFAALVEVLSAAKKYASAAEGAEKVRGKAIVEALTFAMGKSDSIEGVFTVKVKVKGNGKKGLPPEAQEAMEAEAAAN